MGDRTAIEWADASWNPISGCTRISQGCANCYAERFSERFRGVGGHYYERGFDPQIRPQQLDVPRRWKRPRRIFLASMGDIFHEAFLETDHLQRVFDVVDDTPRHTYLVLTKRPALADWFFDHRYSDAMPPNLWVGTSVEDRKTLRRLEWLLRIPAARLFVSFEPLLENLRLDNLRGIDWAIVGGESGPRARPIEANWVRSIRDVCTRDSVAFFFKQWGGARPKSGGRELDGRTWDEMP